MRDEFNLFNEVRNELSGQYREKIENWLGKNPDLIKFVNNQGMNMEMKLKKWIAPKTSVEVERSSSC
jgi:hypothetical protein